MFRRKMVVAIVLFAMSLVFFGAATVAYGQVGEGYDSLQAFSEAQGVELAYDEEGRLVDRGTTEGADMIMATLTDDWGYPVVESDFDPNDPLINTASEYMFQMATIGTHTLHGTQTIVLTEDVEYEGEFFAAGEYEFDIDGRYWTGFDRKHPLEGPARGMAWNGTVHGLFAELGVGAVTANVLQIGLAIAAMFAAIGLVCLVMSGAFVYLAFPPEDK